MNYNKLYKLEGWGDLSIKNLRDAIYKSKKIFLDKFIFSIGIRHIGQENAKTLAEFFGSIKNFSKLFDLKNRLQFSKDLKELDGIGETQIESINSFFLNKTNVRIIKELILELDIKNKQSKSKKGVFLNKKLMFTGGFKEMSRSEAKTFVENNGGKVLGSVSKKLDYLVIGDTKPTKKR